MIRYASVCDGISAVSVAWRHLGWECAWCSEIDPFACAVLAERWPDHHNVGDMLAIDERIRDRGTIDTLVGGTPCQSFSVAGLRGGLDDPRGNLALRFCQLAGTLRPRWVVWENVPGVLSSNRGRDFGAIVGALEQLGYGVAYRILDAQFYGVPQRRRRVFVVGHLGDWRRSAAVLFDATSLRGDSAARGKTRASVAGALTRRIDRGGVNSEGHDNHLIAGTVSAKWAKGTGGPSGDECQNLIAHTLRGEGFDASEDGTGRGTPLAVSPLNAGMGRRRGSGSHGDPLVAVAYRIAGDGAVYESGDRCSALTTNTDQNANILAFQTSQSGVRVSQTRATLDANNGSRRYNGVAYQCQGSNVGPMGTLRAGNGNETGGVPFVPLAIQGRARGDDGRGYARPEQIDVGVCGTLDTVKPHAVLAGPTLAVRRLTPRECERLQGFPDDYTLITYRGKPAADGPRYKAIGNSMAEPVMRRIGERIAFVDQIGNGLIESL